jgi:hypothetical protein
VEEHESSRSILAKVLSYSDDRDAISDDDADDDNDGDVNVIKRAKSSPAVGQIKLRCATCKFRLAGLIFADKA